MSFKYQHIVTEKSFINVANITRLYGHDLKVIMVETNCDVCIEIRTMLKYHALTSLVRHSSLGHPESIFARWWHSLGSTGNISSMVLQPGRFFFSPPPPSRIVHANQSRINLGSSDELIMR